MAAVIPMLPDLDSRGEVLAFWQGHGTLTPRIMALAVAGYPSLLVFLADIAIRPASNPACPILG
jgi:hypothetical protein